MTAAVFGFSRAFDHSRMLAQDPRFTEGADWVRLFEVDDEDAVFRLYLDGHIKDGKQFLGTVHFDRSYFVDERAGEMWTINPHSGAALSSATWEFDD